MWPRINSDRNTVWIPCFIDLVGKTFEVERPESHTWSYIQAKCSQLKSLAWNEIFFLDHELPPSGFWSSMTTAVPSTRRGSLLARSRGLFTPSRPRAS